MTEGAEKPAILLTTAEITKILPHRWPFLLVDRIVELDEERGYIKGQKGVTASEWFFQGHFPQMPVMPGVLQVEALAQTLGVYVGQLDDYKDQIGLFAGIDGCRFRRVVQPGDTLDLEITITKLGRRMAKAHAVASVDGEVACETDISAIIAPEGALR
jgi:3-hydroxyacyl-[acyl-carrier-protein] dehydratase